MRVIYKYPLEVAKRNKIKMPEDWIPRLFEGQDGVPTLWAEVDLSYKKKEFNFLISKTGKDVTMGSLSGAVDFVDSCIIGKNVLFLYRDLG